MTIDSELNIVWNGIDKKERNYILVKAFSVAIKDTISSKVEATKYGIGLGKSLFKKAKGIIVDTKQKGYKYQFSILQNSLKNLPKDSVVFINEKIDLFKNLSSKKQLDLISSAILASLIFSISAGGSDLEGGLPDQDLKLGIGFHRNIFSHSILIGIPVEIILRFSIEIFNSLYSHLPENRSDVWDKVNSFIQSNKNIAIGAMWIGIGAHLLKDSAVLLGGFKPYSGLGFSMNTAMHKTLFVTNSALSTAFGFTEITKSNK